MAYEVVKVVRGRPYRYRVESFRDPASGKPRSKWEYLGPAPDAPPRLDRAEAMRRRLLEALERLLARSGVGDLTAGAIAAEAGAAHGTFYRHFPDVRGAIRAAIRTLADAVHGAPADAWAAPGTADEERARLRAWAEASLDLPLERLPLVRAYWSMVANDPELGAERQLARGARRNELSAYLERLRAANIPLTADSNVTARVVSALLEGIVRGAIVDDEPVEPAVRAAVIDAIERAVFGPPPPGSGTA